MQIYIRVLFLIMFFTNTHPHLLAVSYPSVQPSTTFNNGDLVVIQAQSSSDVGRAVISDSGYYLQVDTNSSSASYTQLLNNMTSSSIISGLISSSGNFNLRQTNQPWLFTMVNSATSGTKYGIQTKVLTATAAYRNLSTDPGIPKSYFGGSNFSAWEYYSITPGSGAGPTAFWIQPNSMSSSFYLSAGTGNSGSIITPSTSWSTGIFFNIINITQTISVAATDGKNAALSGATTAPSISTGNAVYVAVYNAAASKAYALTNYAKTSGTLGILYGSYGNNQQASATSRVNVTSSLSSLVSNNTLMLFPGQYNTKLNGGTDPAPGLDSLFVIYQQGSSLYADLPYDNETYALPLATPSYPAFGSPTSGFTVLWALYGSRAGGFLNVTSLAQSLVSNNQIVFTGSAQAMNTQFKIGSTNTDPAQGFVKGVIIVFSYNNNLYVQIVGENDAATVSVANATPITAYNTAYASGVTAGTSQGTTDGSIPGPGPVSTTSSGSLAYQAGYTTGYNAAFYPTRGATDGAADGAVATTNLPNPGNFGTTYQNAYKDSFYGARDGKLASTVTMAAPTTFGASTATTTATTAPTPTTLTVYTNAFNGARDAKFYKPQTTTSVTNINSAAYVRAYISVYANTGKNAAQQAGATAGALAGAASSITATATPTVPTTYSTDYQNAYKDAFYGARDGQFATSGTTAAPTSPSPTPTTSTIYNNAFNGARDAKFYKAQTTTSVTDSNSAAYVNAYTTVYANTGKAAAQQAGATAGAIATSPTAPSGYSSDYNRSFTTAFITAYNSKTSAKPPFNNGDQVVIQLQGGIDNYLQIDTGTTSASYNQLVTNVTSKTITDNINKLNPTTQPWLFTIIKSTVSGAMYGIQTNVPTATTSSRNLKTDPNTAKVFFENANFGGWEYYSIFGSSTVGPIAFWIQPNSMQSSFLGAGNGGIIAPTSTASLFNIINITQTISSATTDGKNAAKTYTQVPSMSSGNAIYMAVYNNAANSAYNSSYNATAAATAGATAGTNAANAIPIGAATISGFSPEYTSAYAAAYTTAVKTSTDNGAADGKAFKTQSTTDKSFSYTHAYNTNYSPTAAASAGATAGTTDGKNALRGATPIDQIMYTSDYRTAYTISFNQARGSSDGQIDGSNNIAKNYSSTDSNYQTAYDTAYGTAYALGAQTIADINAATIAGNNQALADIQARKLKQYCVNVNTTDPNELQYMDTAATINANIAALSNNTNPVYSTTYIQTFISSYDDEYDALVSAALIAQNSVGTANGTADGNLAKTARIISTPTNSNNLVIDLNNAYNNAYQTAYYTALGTNDGTKAGTADAQAATPVQAPELTASSTQSQAYVTAYNSSYTQAFTATKSKVSAAQATLDSTAGTADGKKAGIIDGNIVPAIKAAALSVSSTKSKAYVDAYNVAYTAAFNATSNQTAAAKAALDAATGTKNGTAAGTKDGNAAKPVKSAALTVTSTQSKAYVDAYNTAYIKAFTVAAKKSTTPPQTKPSSGSSKGSAQSAAAKALQKLLGK